VSLQGGFSLANFAQAAAGARVQVCVTRSTHAAVDRSSTARLFEMASLGSCMVCNPVQGLDAWFEAGSELMVAADEAAVIPLYARLLKSPGLRAEIGGRARKRVLEGHTTAHRARQFTRLLGSL
jgi:spore maturation protein CgeB